MLLTLRTELTKPWEAGPDLSAALASGEFSRLAEVKLRSGKTSASVKELFEVQEDSDEVIKLQGDFTRIDCLASDWSAGKLIVEGNVGDRFAQSMSGGEIIVNGNAGDCLASGMSGGKITVTGNVGHEPGGPLPGEWKGMTGGDLIVHGSAGNRVGAHLRRGTVVVWGEAGDDVGVDMLAGTIVLGKAASAPLGFGMVRGTIIQLDPTSPTPGFHLQEAVIYQPTFLRVLFKYLQNTTQLPLPNSLLDQPFRRFLGDMLEGERGEVLVATNN